MNIYMRITCVAALGAAGIVGETATVAATWAQPGNVDQDMGGSAPGGPAGTRIEAPGSVDGQAARLVAFGHRELTSTTRQRLQRPLVGRAVPGPENALAFRQGSDADKGSGESQPFSTKPLPAKAVTVQANGLRFRVLINGPEQGRAIMLLHGYPQDAHTWDYISEALVRYGYRTIAPDLRGTAPGTMPADGVAFIPPAVVDDVVGIADALGIARFDICGFGIGGAMAWITAATVPDRIRSVIALRFPHPAAFGRAILDDPEQSRLWREHRKAKNPEGKSSLAAQAEALLKNDATPLRSFLLKSGLPADAVDRQVARLSRPGALEGALAWGDAITPEYLATITSVTVPTLFVWSEGPGLASETAHLTKQYVDAPYQEVVLEDAGHFFIETSPQQLIPYILQHLASTDVRH